MPPAQGWSADEALELLYVAHWRRLVRLSVLLVHDQGVAEEVVQDCSWPCTPTGAASANPTGRWPTCARASSTGRAPTCGTRPSYDGTPRARHRHGPRRAPTTRRTTGPSGPPCSALSGASRRQREVIALRYYLDLSEAEIAETLGISRGAVKSHASRGAAALRGLLADQLEETR